MNRAFMLAVLCLAAVLAGGCRRSATVTEFRVVPEPLFMVQKDGEFVLDRTPRLSLYNVGQNSPTVRYILKSLRQAHIHPRLVGLSEGPDIELAVNDTLNPELGDEGYLIEVMGSAVRLSANTERGLFHAYQTFVQMLPPDVTRQPYQRVGLPSCTILDRPRLEWRALNLDVSSHFFAPKELRKVVDAMAAYKLNRLVLHLTDDQGWRLASDRFAPLAEVGAWRVEREGYAWDAVPPPQPDERTPYGGFYTRSEMEDLVAYAADRGVEVVPELSLPSHCSALLAAMPRLACDAGPYHVQPGASPSPDAALCAGNDSALALCRTILAEVSDIFPSPYIALANTAPDGERWRACPRCQHRVRALHLGGTDGLRRWMAAQLVACIDSLGRRAVVSASGPAEVVDGAAVNVVSDPVLADRLARRGMAVVNAASAYTSFDRYQADRRFQPPASWGSLTLAQVYRFDPCPDSWGARVAARVRGAQCMMPTRYVDSPSELEYMLLPRLLAFAEDCWTTPEKKDWSRFRLKVERQKTRLATKGYAYCEGSFTPSVGFTPARGGTANVEISTEVPSTYIFYTTDGSRPTRQSSVYVGPVNLPSGTTLRLLPVYKDIERDTVYDFVVK